MKRPRFEWDEAKDKENQTKHCVSFAVAQQALLDHQRIISRRIRAIAAKRSGITASGGLVTAS